MRRFLDMYRSLHITIKASFWFTVASLFQKGLAFLATPIYTRLLSTEDYGIYSVYVSWLGVITIFATLNLSAGVLNNALLNEDKFNSNDEEILSNFQFLEMMTISLVMAIIIVLKLLFPKALSLPIKALIMMAFSIFFSSAMSLWSIKERYRFRYFWVTVISIISSLATVVFNLLFVYFGNNSSFALIYGTTFAAVLSNMAIMAMNLIKGKKVFNFRLWKYAVCFNLPLIPHYLASTILVCADKIMIDRILSASQAGLYAVAYSLGNIVIVFANAINSSLAPYTYQKLRSGGTEGIATFTNAVFALLLVISGAVMMAGPELIYMLGGSKYLEAKWVIPPVAGAIVFFFMYPMFANIEFYYEKRLMTMIASVIAAVANIILNLVFIPVYGYAAAAFTTLVCYMLLSLSHYFFYKTICKGKDLKNVYDEKRIAVFSVITLVIIVISYFLYLNDVIRYCCMVVAIIFVVALKKKLINAIKRILKK